MFLARRQFGQSARVYPIRAVGLHPRSWTFSGAAPGQPLARLSTPGHAAIGRTREEALSFLQANDEAAADELAAVSS